MAQHQILIVANQTLGGDHLVEAARERVGAGADAVWIVVPATPPPEDPAASSLPTDLGVVRPLDVGRSPAPDPYTIAERRLERARDQFRVLGVPVGGEVGDEDPLRAIGDALAAHPSQEVLISTLPRAVSHWLRVDLPSRVHRRFGVPVTTVPAPAGRHG